MTVATQMADKLRGSIASSFIPVTILTSSWRKLSFGWAKSSGVASLSRKTPARHRDIYSGSASRWWFVCWAHPTGWIRGESSWHQNPMKMLPFRNKILKKRIYKLCYDNMNECWNLIHQNFKATWNNVYVTIQGDAWPFFLPLTYSKSY